MSVSFGDIRALIHHPSHANWRAIVEACRQWPDPHELHEVVLPYCKQALGLWPDTMRHAPAEWTNAALRDLQGEDPGITLARSLQFAPTPGRNPSWYKLWEHYDLAGVSSLEFYGNGGKLKLPRKDFGRLLDKLDDAPPRALKFEDMKFKPEHWAQFTAWEGLEQVESLALTRCRLKPFDVASDEDMTLAALTGRECRGLKHVCLRDNKLRAADMLLLTQAKWADRLQTLRLGAVPRDPYSADSHVWFNRLEQEGVSALTQPGVFPALEALELSYHQIHDVSGSKLFDAAFPSLKQLDLHQNYFKSPIQKGFERASWLGQLESLDVSGNAIGAGATRVLCDLLQGGAMRTLKLNRINIGISGIRHLMASPSLNNLTTLEFSENGLLENELCVFSSTPLEHLEHLSFLSNVLHDKSYDDFVNAPFLSSLKSLKIPSLSDEQVIELLEHPELQKLERLCVYSRRQFRDEKLAAHPLGHKLEFVREQLYHYLYYTPLMISLPGFHDAVAR